MSVTAPQPFEWVPVEGPDAAALKRMAQAFPKPADPMGEAWFMSSERKIYSELLGDLDAVPDGDLAKALEEIASGTSSFGPSAEWTKWYHYLLPRLMGRSWKPTYFDQGELLFTAFMVQHPSAENDFAYDGFRSDVLATLGRYIMSPKFWPDGKLDPERCLGKRKGPTGIAGWSDAGPLLSASLLFCIKYLPANRIEPWFRSAIAIADRSWQAQIATWLVGAHALLTDEIAQPSQFPESGTFGIRWSWSHILDGDGTGQREGAVQNRPFLPDDSRRIVLRIARDWDVEETLEAFMTDPETRSATQEVTRLPESFLQLYR